ncbi:MAG: hypothetical protein U0794_19375 [Isosphaeraceae bacterium]
MLIPLIQQPHDPAPFELPPMRPMPRCFRLIAVIGLTGFLGFAPARAQDASRRTGPWDVGTLLGSTRKPPG